MTASPAAEYGWRRRSPAIYSSQSVEEFGMRCYKRQNLPWTWWDCCPISESWGNRALQSFDPPRWWVCCRWGPSVLDPKAPTWCDGQCWECWSGLWPESLADANACKLGLFVKQQKGITNWITIDAMYCATILLSIWHHHYLPKANWFSTTNWHVPDGPSLAHVVGWIIRISTSDLKINYSSV